MNRPTTSWRSVAVGGAAGALVGLGLLVLPGMAQPERGVPGGRPPPGEARAGSERGDMSAADLRARLVRRVEDARLIEQRLQAGIDRLDAGDDPQEVMRGLFEPGGMRGGEGPGWRGGDARGPMNPEERERLMSMIRERMPRVAEWIAELEREEPRLLEAVRARLAPQLREVERLWERDPEGARVRTEELVATFGVMRATRVYRGAVVRDGADGASTQRARASLREALVTQFESRLAARRHEVGALGQRIEELSADIDAQTAGRAQFIEAALEQITQAALRPAAEGGPHGGPEEGPPHGAGPDGSRPGGGR